jgi:hypothetical protein
VGAINIWSSSIESINNFNMIFNEKSPFYWMEYAINDKNKSLAILQFISHLSGRYIIVDTSIANSDKINDFFKSNDDVKLMYNTSFLNVYENTNYISEISIPKIIVNGNYSDPVFLQLNTSEYKNIAIIDAKNLQNNSNSNLDYVDRSTANINEIINRLNKNTNPATIIEYTKINPTLFKVKVDAQKPFMLEFTESYDPLWEVHVDRINKIKVRSENVHPIPVYSAINGFWITDTGTLEITIEYQQQKWLYNGLFISGFTFVGCVGYLLWNRRKSRAAQ